VCVGVFYDEFVVCSVTSPIYCSSIFLRFSGASSTRKEVIYLSLCSLRLSVCSSVHYYIVHMYISSHMFLLRITHYEISVMYVMKTYFVII